MSADAGWRDPGTAAAALGLALFEAGPRWNGVAWAEHLRLRGERIVGAAPHEVWMMGRRGEVDVLLRRGNVTNQHVVEARYDTMAAIDPPLLLGVSIERDDPLHDSLAPEHRRVGYAQFDADYTMRAPDRRTGEALRRVFPAVMAQVPWGCELFLSDAAVVLFSHEDVPSTPTLEHRLDAAIEIARLVGEPLRNLQDTPMHHSLLDALGVASDAAGFVLDQRRFRIEGDVQMAIVRLAVESEVDGFRTALDVELARPLGLGLDLQPRGSGLRAWLGRRSAAGKELRLGPGPLDRVAKAEARDEAGARRLLGTDALVSAVLALAAESDAWSVTDDRLSAGWPDAIDDAVKLGRILAIGRGVAEGLTLKSHLPYR